MATATNVSTAPLAFADGASFRVRGPDGVSGTDSDVPVITRLTPLMTAPGGSRTSSWFFPGTWFDGNGHTIPAPPGTYVVVVTVSEYSRGIVAQKTVTFDWP